MELTATIRRDGAGYGLAVTNMCLNVAGWQSGKGCKLRISTLRSDAYGVRSPGGGINGC